MTHCLIKKDTSNLIITHQAPSVDEFLLLREKIGWANPAHEVAQLSLDNSLFHVCVHKSAQLLGYGRVVGDGAMYFYIQDIMVNPDFQQQGIGAQIMNQIESFLENTAQSGATIGLFAAYNKEAFYEKFGYCSRTGVPLGLGMCRFIK
ncbi:GNAT family N-acetyltransferase [Pseudoalteromonas phenolica]|uniref:GNAT family N-acetyltransferase n=1 Tax=Pseudoalteromonas phenolica TaxID=161398 RepID=UPI0038515EAB